MKTFGVTDYTNLVPLKCCRRTDGRTYLQDGRSEVSNGSKPLQIYGVNLVKLTPQAHFNPITPYCNNPNLTLISLNTAVQIANLIMYCGHVMTDGRPDRLSGPTTRPAFAKATQVKNLALMMQNAYNTS